MKMNQYTVPVADFAKSVAFYEALGLRLIVSARGEYARFEVPGDLSTLSLSLSKEPVPASGLIYFEVDDVDETIAILKDCGIAVDEEPSDKPYLWREAKLRDPTGNRICVYHAGENRRFPPWRISG